MEKAGYISEEAYKEKEAIRSNYKELFDLTSALNSLAQELFLSLKPHNRDPQALLAAILFRRILDFFQGAFHMAAMGIEGPLMVLLRAQYEALALLIANNSDSEFFRMMVDDDEHRRLKLLNNSKIYSSPLFDEVRKYAHLEKELEKLKSKNPKRLSIFSIFKKAGLEVEYKSVYAILSNPSHHGIRTLEKYFITEEEGDEIVSLQWGPDRSCQEDYFNIGCGSLINAMESVYSLFEVDNKALKDRAINIANEIKKILEMS
jgi:hypothetical protein